jgi:hypothetical protein
LDSRIQGKRGERRVKRRVNQLISRAKNNKSLRNKKQRGRER